MPPCEASSWSWTGAREFNQALGTGNAVVADKVELELDIAAVKRPSAAKGPIPTRTGRDHAAELESVRPLALITELRTTAPTCTTSTTSYRIGATTT